MTEFNGDVVTSIKVIGVGGGGNNAVNRMIEETIRGVEFYVLNTDQAALNKSACVNRVKIGEGNGNGAGNKPDQGREAALKSEEEIRDIVADTDLVFIAAGMGGGTGTGAAPVVAKIAREQGALVIAVVTTPFEFEGIRRLRQADEGLIELQKYADSTIIVSNEKLMEILGDVNQRQAFKEADNVLRQGVQAIAELITHTEDINVDFNDVKDTMQDAGLSLIGIGQATGEERARVAALNAVNNPLLEASIRGAKKAIVNVSGGENLRLSESKEAVRAITEAAGNDIDIIYSSYINEQLDDQIIVTIIATGFENVKDNNGMPLPKKEFTSTVVSAPKSALGNPSIHSQPAPTTQTEKEKVVDDEPLSGFLAKNRLL